MITRRQGRARCAVVDLGLNTQIGKGSPASSEWT
jgi:hypothetical protein